jgi:hypothetical protein
MPICYQKAGLKYPTKVIQVSSPIVGAFASSIANKILKKGGAVRGAVRGAVGGAVDDAVGGAVGGAVDDAVDDAVRGAVDDAVDDAVGDAVRGAVGDAVGDAVDDAVDGAVGGAVGDAVRGAVGDAVDDAVGDAVRGAVDDAVRDAKLDWHYWLGGQFWVGGWYWGSPSWVSFFTDVCDLKLSDDIKERATAYRKVCESVNYIWCNSEFVMVCARPTKIERNILGRLHCENGKAIEYPDTWGLFFLNGVRFEEEMYWKVVKSQSEGGLSFAERLAIEDIDQRTQAINPKYADIDGFIEEAEGELLDEVNKFDINGEGVNYKLYKFPKGDIFQEDAYYCYFDCPSTRKKHLEGVEVSKTVAECMAWAMSTDDVVVSPEQWSLMIPLAEEN